MPISTPSSTDRVPLPREFYIVLLTTLCFSLSLTLIIPILPLYITDELSAAEHWIGTATLFVALAAVSTRLPGGALSDHYGRRKLMLIGAVFELLGALLYAFSTGIGVFLLGRISTGISLGFFTTANKALAADLAPASRRGEALGYANAAFSMAAIISPLFSDFIKNTISYQAVFITSAILALVTLAVTYTLPRTRPLRTVGQTARGDIRQTLQERGTWAASLLIMATAPVLALMFTFFPLIADRRDLFADAPGLLAGISIGMGLSLHALTDTVIEPLAGSLSDRIGRLPVAIPGLIVMVVGVALLSQASTTQSTFLAIIVLSSGWGTTRAISDSVVQDAVPSALRGMGAAVLYTAFDVGVGVNAQWLSTLIEGSDFQAFFRATIAIIVAMGIIGLLFSRGLKTHDQRHPTIDEFHPEPVSASD